LEGKNSFSIIPTMDAGESSVFKFNTLNGSFCMVVFGNSPFSFEGVLYFKRSSLD
jgi:hypothetical protein